MRRNGPGDEAKRGRASWIPYRQKVREENFEADWNLETADQLDIYNRQRAFRERVLRPLEHRTDLAAEAQLKTSHVPANKYGVTAKTAAQRLMETNNPLLLPHQIYGTSKAAASKGDLACPKKAAAKVQQELSWQCGKMPTFHRFDTSPWQPPGCDQGEFLGSQRLLLTRSELGRPKKADVSPARHQAMLQAQFVAQEIQQRPERGCRGRAA